MNLHIVRSSLLTIVIILCSLSANAQENDTLLCNRVFAYAFEHKLIEKPIGAVIATVGKQFLGRPYEAHTLDRSDKEQLVTDLHSFDCVTFIENVVAIALSIKSDRLSFSSYREALQRLRYRDGVINGYASRLHYFSEWIRDHERNKILQDVTLQTGGRQFKKKISFMTAHRTAYPMLADDSTFASLKKIEEQITEGGQVFIPKEKIKAAQEKMEEGDIIAITTTIDGLDVSHTGIAVKADDGQLHYMHAPNVNGNVKISDEPLWEYVQKHSSNSGIMVARVIDVRE